MKKILSILLVALMLLCVMCGCGQTKQPENQKLSIVTTIFPEYDWVRELLGEKAADADVKMLLDKGVDLHSFQPTAQDIISISNCDMFIYVGGESDKWVKDALKSISSKAVVISLLEVLGESVKTEEAVEGMEAEEGEDDEEADEHVWLSLENAEKICEYISEKLGEIDPENKVIYEKNAEAYEEKLEALDSSFEAVVSSAKNKTLLFADRFPFRYFADDYGISYYAAFSGCSSETEASFETISFLSKKVDELGLKCVMKLEGADEKIASTVISNTQTKDQKILSMDSMQSITMADVESGATYLSIMEKNLETLKIALG